MRELRDGTPADPAFQTCFPAPISIKTALFLPSLLTAVRQGQPRTRLRCGCQQTLKYRLTLNLIEKQPQPPPSNAGAAGVLRAGPGSSAAPAQIPGRPRSSMRRLAALSSAPGALTGERLVAPRHRLPIRASGRPHAPLAGQSPGRAAPRCRLGAAEGTPVRDGIRPGPAPHTQNGGGGTAPSPPARPP